MTAAPAFTQSGTLPLFALSSRGDPGLPGFWAGYRRGPASALSGTVTPDQVWQDDGGTYVFTNARPADDGQFSAALGDYLAQVSPAGLVRFIWIADAAAEPDAWQSATLPARPAGSGARLAWTVARETVLAVGEYAVQLDRGTALTQAGTALGPGIAAGALSFAGPATALAAAAGTAWLPLAGPALGCWCAALPVPAGGPDVFSGLRAGLRYAAPRGDGAAGEVVDVLDVPLLTQDGAALTLYLSFDWLNPLAHARTRLGFFDAAGTGDPGPPLAAALRTSLGYRTTLAPRAHGAPLRPAALVLDRSPLSVSAAPAWVYHLAPDGAFDIAVASPGPSAPAASAAAGPVTGQSPGRVIFGLSGLEYATLPAGRGTAFFAAGQPAFAPAAASDAAPARPDAAALTGAATTAYLTLLPSAPGPGLTYYAQPQQAPLYAGSTALDSGLLGFCEVAAAALPDWQRGASAAPATVPALPLAGVAPDDGPLAGRIERAVLAPARRRALGVAPGEMKALADGSGTLAVTPQGLLVQVGAAGFDRVVLAALPGTAAGQLDISKVGPELRAALQSNELFFAVGDPVRFLADSSVRYRLDAAGLAAAKAGGVPDNLIAALRPKVLSPSGVPVVFATEQDFDAAVTQAAAGAYRAQLREIAGFLKAELSGWTFQLSPRSWRTGPHPTVMLVKYAHRPITELAEDGSAWGWPQAAGGAQETLRATVKAARAREQDETVPRDDPYAAFYRDVLANPAWNGVLFLNAPVSVAELPPELSFMAADIEPGGFLAHHLGFAATPVTTENGAIAVRQTAAFGLIDYSDPADLILDPGSPNPDFGFKTLSLTARFAGAALAGFATRVELMVNRLLGAPLTKLDPAHGNNLLLSGSSQRQGGTGQGDVLGYAFTLEGEHRYRADASAIDSIQVDDVRVTTSSAGARDGSTAVTFALGGFLRFGDHPAFDMFGYGPAAGDPGTDSRLRFDDLRVEMRVAPAGPRFARQRFTESTGSVRFEPRRSMPREHSLIRNFPVTLTGLTAAREGSPADAGFASVSAPREQSPLSGPWWALTYRLDLGTMGALAGSAGLSLMLAAAWGPGVPGGDGPVYCGLQLPAGLQWSLQGVLKLGFRSFQFQTGPAADARRLTYVLRLRRYALQVLGISLPPGNTDVALFGEAGSRVVGWYAVYDNDDKDKRKGTP